MAAGTPRADSADMKQLTFLSGTGLVSLHQIDAAVDVEPGASLARHLSRPAVTPRVAPAAALSFRRLPHAAAAGSFAADPLARRSPGAALFDRPLSLERA
jgi:hypothetical protein